MTFQLSGVHNGLTADMSVATTDPQSRPALAIQVNALQAMCRQVFGFRLAMIAIATPFAISHTSFDARMFLSPTVSPQCGRLSCAKYLADD